MTALVAVRPATPADHGEVVRIFLACWRTSYRGTLPPRLIAAMTNQRADTLWRRVLTEAEADAQSGEVLLAVDEPGGTPLGVTRFGVTADGEGIVQSLYVDPAAQGGGVGGHLLRHVVTRLAETQPGERQPEVARLWVFRDNAPSRRFYARHGFTEDGAVRVQEELGEPEIRLARALPGPVNTDHHARPAALISAALSTPAPMLPPPPPPPDSPRPQRGTS